MGKLIDDVVEADHEVARAIARRADVIDQARAWSEATASLMPPDPSVVRRWRAEAVARRSLVSELAAALRLAERTAENLIEESRSLLRRLPGAMAALSEGDISHHYAQVIVDHANSLPEDMRRSFEKAALPFAEKPTASRFDRKALVLRERAHPESIELRHSVSRDKRELSLQPGRNGMSWLTAHLPSATAEAIYKRVTDVATQLQSPTEPRTLTQLRADVFSHLVIDDVTTADHARQPNLGRGIRARVLITVPVLTLLGHSIDGQGTEPAMLEGYGPIDIETARILAADAPGFTRILTHPETGAVLSLGRDRSAIPPDLRAWLRMRDETCRGPGCGAAARRCDLDHTQDWQHSGRADHDNLAHLCPKHHDQKHHTGWTVEPTSDGDLQWISPSRHRYLTEPAIQILP